MGSCQWPVRLRPLKLPDDIKWAQPWYSDPEVLYLSEGPTSPPFDAARVERMYQYLAERGDVYIIEVYDQVWRPVGDITLTDNDMTPIVIGEARYRNHGVGTEALQLLIEKARQKHLGKLVAHAIFQYNPRSARLFEKCGFKRTASGVDSHGQAFWRYEYDLADDV